MQDFIGGIKQIGPTYPVKPIQPTQKDRKPGERSQKEPPPRTGDDDHDEKPSIDEHV
jgi:hypothetical protein